MFEKKRLVSGFEKFFGSNSHNGIDTYTDKNVAEQKYINGGTFTKTICSIHFLMSKALSCLEQWKSCIHTDSILNRNSLRWREKT